MILKAGAAAWRGGCLIPVWQRFCCSASGKSFIGRQISSIVWRLSPQTDYQIEIKRYWWIRLRIIWKCGLRFTARETSVVVHDPNLLSFIIIFILTGQLRSAASWGWLSASPAVLWCALRELLSDESKVLLHGHVIPRGFYGSFKTEHHSRTVRSRVICFFGFLLYLFFFCGSFLNHADSLFL